MKFKYKLLTQTQLGLLFGATSHEVGKWLVQCGLRDAKTKRPTATAHNEKLCDTAPSGQVGYCWAWDATKTVQRLVEAGHPLLAEPPSQLVESPQMVGPFQVEPTDKRNIVNSEGQFVLKASVEAHAAGVVMLLNAAHRHGTLQKLIPSSVSATA